MEDILKEMMAQRKLMQEQIDLQREQLDMHRDEVKQLKDMVKQGGLAPSLSKDRTVFMDIAQRVPRFVFDCDVENCFSTWYERYKSVFVIDAAELDDNAKVRALLERLD